MPLDEKTLERLVQEQRLAGPKKPAAEIRETTELFEEYVRPAQPGEAPKSKGLRAQGYQFPPPGGPTPPMTHANMAKGVLLPPIPPSGPQPAVAVEATPMFEEYRRPDASALPPEPAPPAASHELPAFPEPEPAPPSSASASSASVPLPTGIPTGEAAAILRDFEPAVPQVQTPKRFTILPPMPAHAPAPAFAAAMLAPPGHAPEPDADAGPVSESGGPAESSSAPRALESGEHPAPQSTPHRSDAPPLQAGATVQIGIVQSEFNRDITDAMTLAARDEARRLGCPVNAHVKVPGVFDTPLAAQMLLQRPDVEAVVVIGCVIQGETGHDELITQASAKQLLELACKFEKPVALGVTGPRMTRAQAMARIESGAFAMASAVAQSRLLRTA